MKCYIFISLWTQPLLISSTTSQVVEQARVRRVLSGDGLGVRVQPLGEHGAGGVRCVRKKWKKIMGHIQEATLFFKKIHSKPFLGIFK